MVTKSEKVAWAAGLFEGEGCITITGRPGVTYSYARLLMQMVDEDVVRKFAAVVTHGTIVITKPQEAHHQVQYRWQASKRHDVEEILLLFLPYLGKRRTAKAKLALELIHKQNTPHARKRKT